MTAPVMSWMNLGKDHRTAPQTQESNSGRGIKRRLLQKSCLVLNVLNSVMYKCMDILMYCRFSDARFKFIDHWKMDVDEWIDEMR